MLNFDVAEKSLGIVFPPFFAYDFSRRILLVLYSISWPNFIDCLHLLRYQLICELQLFVNQS